ncbi:lipase [Legionella antarctica]|uniref:Lipase n=1 Tax=Legionella antarctica TaxID=2708020 RepID=A0A6F8T9J1_9GAMM|nr:alpha/beta fold hydrolase [Legionella antarctica]BCA96830.1 lipase [Legionella antarctica]
MKVLVKKIQTKKFILLLSFGIIYINQSVAFLPNSNMQTPTATLIVPVKAKHHQEVIVLIHGLLRSYLSMKPLKLYLETQGYQVYYYNYPSARYTIHEHASYLNQFIRHLSANNSRVKIHFVTHSLGGIIVREALSKWSPNQLKHIGSLIMLAPPNQGSLLAKLSTEMFPLITSSIKPLAELSSEKKSYVHRVPVPNIKMGIIAGRFDAKVPPSAARIQGQTAPIVINSTHTFIMNHAKTRKLIMTFLKKGSFEE